MLRWRVRSEVQPRSKNGLPPHSTIGAVSASWIHGDASALTNWTPISSAIIDITRTGTTRTAETQNRRVKSTSSGLGASSSEGSSGSSAMPQIGQVPGPS